MGDGGMTKLYLIRHAEAEGNLCLLYTSLLMLDEPSMGLAPLLVEQIFDIIRQLHADGTTILLVEQNAQAAPVSYTHLSPR